MENEKSIRVNFLDYNDEKVNGILEYGGLYPKNVKKGYANTPYFMTFESRSFGNERGFYASLVKDGRIVDEGYEVEEWDNDNEIYHVVDFKPIEI